MHSVQKRHYQALCPQLHALHQRLLIIGCAQPLQARAAAQAIAKTVADIQSCSELIQGFLLMVAAKVCFNLCLSLYG